MDGRLGFDVQPPLLPVLVSRPPSCCTRGATGAVVAPSALGWYRSCRSEVSWCSFILRSTTLILKMPSVVLIPGRKPFCISWSSCSEIAAGRVSSGVGDDFVRDLQQHGASAVAGGLRLPFFSKVLSSLSLTLLFLDLQEPKSAPYVVGRGAALACREHQALSALVWSSSKRILLFSTDSRRMWVK
jgi:hypothetical protein